MTASPAASAIEVIRPDFPRGRFRAVLFDFDGTISLIRRNWQAVMIPMMVEELQATGTAESPDALAAHVEEFVMRLNGRQTIYQMMQLADEVRQRGAEPLEPLAYKNRYHDRLWASIEHRVAALQQATLTPEEATVPGVHRLLDELQARGLALYLASGTDLKYVREEAALLKVDHYFGRHIYGALDDYQSFSKAMIIEQVLHELGLEGAQILGFGDGFVEIEEVRKVGGVAVGVASEEERREGVNLWKRERLIRAGADLIVGDYRNCDELLQVLGL